jgi:hypothetical protein
MLGVGPIVEEDGPQREVSHSQWRGEYGGGRFAAPHGQSKAQLSQLDSGPGDSKDRFHCIVTQPHTSLSNAGKTPAIFFNGGPG